MSIKVDQQTAAQQFQREENNREKLKELQESVFKNFTIKRSVSVYHDKQHNPSPPKKLSQFFVPILKTERQREIFPAVTTINFGNSQSKVHSQSLRTFSMFAPRITIQVNFRSENREEKLLEKMKKMQLNELKQPQSVREKNYPSRDSQTLLRKNTLFLVNCLKTRYKLRKNVHIGERREAANHMRLGNLSEKKVSTQYQQRFQYMQEAKQRILQAKMMKNIQAAQQSRMSPLYPSPWQTEH